MVTDFRNSIFRQSKFSNLFRKLKFSDFVNLLTNIFSVKILIYMYVNIFIGTPLLTTFRFRLNFDLVRNTKEFFFKIGVRFCRFKKL